MKSRHTGRFLIAASSALLLTAPCFAEEGEPLAVEAEAVAVEAVSEVTVDEAANAEPAAAPIAMDRTAWPRTVVTAAEGKVTHNPHYMGNPPMGEDIVSPLHAPDPIWQIQEALRGADAGNLNGENLIDLGTQPFVGLAQIVLMPVRAVLEHPWANVTSP